MTTGHTRTYFFAVFTFMVLNEHFLLAQQNLRPPRLNKCRLLYKAKTHTDRYDTSCSTLSFPCSVAGQPINLTDTRNCENFFVCDGKSVSQCPCPDATEYNPSTGRCEDPFFVTCVCPRTSSTTMTRDTPGATASPQATTATTALTVGTLSTSYSTARSSADVNKTGKQEAPEDDFNYPALIGGLIAGVVAILILAITSIGCWRLKRSKGAQRSAKGNQPSQSAPGHVYDEIDERMLNDNADSQPSQSNSRNTNAKRQLPAKPEDKESVLDTERSAPAILQPGHRGSFVGQSFIV